MIIKKAGLIKGGRPENADNTRTGSWPLRRGASYGVGSSSGGGRRPNRKARGAYGDARRGGAVGV